MSGRRREDGDEGGAVAASGSALRRPSDMRFQRLRNQVIMRRCWYRPTKDGRAKYAADILKSDAVLGAEGHLGEERAGVADKREVVCE
jgi:hypothetical protein